MIKITQEVVMVVEACYKCGCVFGIEETFQDTLRRNGENFYCPNGHPQHYGESAEKKKLKEALENETWWKNRAESNAREAERVKKQLSSTKGQLTKTKKRLAAGVCPCCNRQFVDLHRHMTGQHPDYAAAEAPAKD